MRTNDREPERGNNTNNNNRYKQKTDSARQGTSPAASVLWGALGAAVVLAGSAIYSAVAEDQENETRRMQSAHRVQTDERWNRYKSQTNTSNGSDQSMSSEQKAARDKGIDDYTEEIESFCCPITTNVMRDPVNTPFGHSYEREAITRWVREHHTDPLTGQPLNVNQLSTAHSLRHAIEEYEARRPVSATASST
ncbi:hypothetical protein SARC_02773 [Sphaeroforma arctica JP610]|uniref:U-box domain-containing protein n=1 Tax=Sphaeroforma arctica JP610 TaxID=667725 RepID=A0A0L0G9T2_9EUKA|nr:hypothetical protein SARC_02773 [Sphaeroforma arctica JP610]KNC85018.1 hypothetical protein SARC_02773 [Sphaeroforma arctica JP610]|eukprot:XP_014158920.1 hypothetical protein SARC_02773 [Sphaeroforma arctica JP610]